MCHYVSKFFLLMICFFLLQNEVLAETYTWTDEQGVLHFTDSEQKRAPNSRKREMPDETGSPRNYSKFIGKWTNRVDSFGFFILIINNDYTGEAQIIQNKIPGTWFALGDGSIQVNLDIIEETKTGKVQQTMKLIAKYDSIQDCLVVKLDNDDRVKKLFRE